MGYTPPGIHRREAPWWVYSSLLCTVGGTLVGIYHCYAPLESPWWVYTTRFTVGHAPRLPANHPFHCWACSSPPCQPPVSLVGVPQDPPPNHPFHCWALFPAPPPTRFTVGLEKEAYRGYPTYPPWYQGGIPRCICLPYRCYLRVFKACYGPCGAHGAHCVQCVHGSGCGKYTFNTRVEEGRPLRKGKVPLFPQNIPLLRAGTGAFWSTIPLQRVPLHKESQNLSTPPKSVLDPPQGPDPPF